MNTSLSKFCKDNSLPKSSVYVRCQELNFDVSDGLTPSMVEQLRHEFDLQSKQQEETPLSPTTVVDSGNHKIVLSAPQLPQRYSLEGLRTGEAIQFDDPLAVAAAFLQDADVLQVAMQQDLEARAARLEATKQAKAAIEAKRQKLELEARLYQLQTQNLDSSLSAETLGLQSELGKLQQFTQPAPTPTPQEQSSSQS
ncbi:hypothetical protein [Leptolyngbya sp. FACHB-8]|uniref:hypothetical protein n=1 Tax=unclassified Leptolyngbya TaxID=2650499 RepID=UPI0016820554|nr:hypothetical protein [Leptolyngbya sp. FACHB-8]MBD1911263.1 hypothetical protein [Leptolyngbya sp. FACHB-8]